MAGRGWLCRILSPKAGPTEGHRVPLVTQAGRGAISSAPSKLSLGLQPPVLRLHGASSAKHQPPPGTPSLPSTSCGSGMFVFQFSFPRTATHSITSWGTGPGAAATPWSPAAPHSASSRLCPSPMETLIKGFSLQSDTLRALGRAARPRLLLRTEREEHPDSRALNA